MTRSRLFLSLLLAGTGLASQSAFAQDASPPPAQPETDEAPDGGVEISAPGGDGLEIIVTGRYIPEPVRNTAQVVSVLSAEEIARAGGGIVSSVRAVREASEEELSHGHVHGVGGAH